MLTAIPTTLMRGGTSKGLYFAASDLPQDIETRDRVLLAAMGSPDARQIDGVGGAHPLTSKIAIISPSTREDADVDYLFLQAAVDKAEVSDSQPCGNILAGVGPWAIDNNLLRPVDDTTPVRIHTVNNGSLAIAHVQTPDNAVTYEGDTCIDGVPGSAAPILIDFQNIAGANCGDILPTGNLIDIVDGVEMTCIDNGMPVVCMRAEDFGLSGKETPKDLEANLNLKERLDKIRLVIGAKMNLGNVASKTVPKMTLLSTPKNGGAISTRSFIPHRVHEAIGVLGAVSVATGCLLQGSIGASMAHIPDVVLNDGALRINVEHPTGSFSVDIQISEDNGNIAVKRAALLRTARKLMRGEVYIPSKIWSGA